MPPVKYRDDSLADLNLMGVGDLTTEDTLRREDVIAIALAALALMHVMANRLCWAGIPLQTDTGMWAYIGGRILDGALPYRDLWESKPPGIYYLFAFVEWLFGRGEHWSLLWLDAFINIGVFGATYALARRFASRIACAGAVLLLSIVFCHRVLADWGVNVEKFVAFFELLACLYVVRGLEGRPRWYNWLFAGVFCGAAACFKQTGVLFFVAAGIGIVFSGLKQKELPSTLVKRIALMAAGGAVIWLPVIIAMSAAGMFPDFWAQVVTYDLARVGAPDAEGSRLMAWAHWSNVGSHLQFTIILFGPALFALGYRFWRIRSGRRRTALFRQGNEQGLDIILLYWVLTLIVFPLAPFGYGHYLLQAAPAAAILAAWLLDRSLRSLGVERYWALAAVASIGFGLWPLKEHFQFTLMPEHEYRRAYERQVLLYNDVVQTISTYTGPDDRVMVWPTDYAISYYAQRVTPLECSNSDVIFKGKIGRLSPPMPELISRLEEEPPDVIAEWTSIRVAPADSRIEGDEPALLVPAGGFALLEEPNDEHRFLEGRMLATLKRWVRANFGGQRRIGECTLYYQGKPWRSWQSIFFLEMPG